MTITLEQARAAKESAKALLAALPGVAGVGITKIGEDYALKVNLSAPLPSGVSAPKHIGDVAVLVEVVGRITKRAPR
jgi:hypothetical protein